MSILKVYNTETNSWIELPSLATPTIEIQDNLESTEILSALSVNQGRLLNEIQNEHETNINNLLTRVTALENLLTSTIIYNDLSWPIDIDRGTVYVGDVSSYKHFLIGLWANGSVYTLYIPNTLLGWDIGAVWEAIDNESATYYCNFKISTDGYVTVSYSGYRLTSGDDVYIRTSYGIGYIEGFKY